MLGDRPDAVPPSDVVEVSLIGPGYGEAVVVHIGNGEWLVVDSCFGRRGSSTSAAVDYLKGIGVKIAEQVSWVVATHWHDDHISGLSGLLAECESAQFCCAIAMSKKEFLHFASVYAATDTTSLATPTKEIIATLELCVNRRRKPRLVSADTLILKSGDVSVYALSPTNERVLEFLTGCAANLPEVRSTKRRIGDLRPNAVAVALWIDQCDDAILLGADLEETPGGAWTAIVSQSAAISARKASVYKVAHHGSVTAECPGIWNKLLAPTPFAILTPFNRGRSPLPTPNDVDRILRRTNEAYSAARIGSTTRKRYSPAVERTIREGGWMIRAANPKLGHLRLRRSLASVQSRWQVDLLGNAIHLRHVHS